MRPEWLGKLGTRIFLDSSDPEETRGAIESLGFLDGQTTNPTLISRHPEIKKRLENGQRFAKEEIYEFYKATVAQIAVRLPSKSVSIEVYCDERTTADEMFRQALEMNSWIPYAHIKFPTTVEGLKAAVMAGKENIKVNMTLCFSQEQASAVYAAMEYSKKGHVFISPFIGRLDDLGLEGTDLVENILNMYRDPVSFGAGHVEVLAASVRSIRHLMRAIHLGTDIVTAPLKVLREWAEAGLPQPDPETDYRDPTLKEIPYKPDLTPNYDWRKVNSRHKLTTAGLNKFAGDWNSLIE